MNRNITVRIFVIYTLQCAMYACMYRVPGPSRALFWRTLRPSGRGFRGILLREWISLCLFLFILKLSASHSDRPSWPTPAALDFDASSLVSLLSRFLFARTLRLLHLLRHHDNDADSEQD